VNPLIFREYDIRGIAATDLPDDEVFKLGQAYGSYILDQGIARCVLARDARLSGPRIAAALGEGIRSTGLDTVDIGMVPTPVFYFSFFHLDADAGMMVTASHNPPEFNGFKVGLNKTTIYGEEIQRLRGIVEAGRFRTGRGRAETTDIVPAYVAMCRSRVTIDRDLKVIFDPGNGTAGILLERLFSGTRVQARFINLEPDGNFPAHVPDPTVLKYMDQCVKLVKDTGADCGIGYDGDGDRIGAVDETGAMVYGDKLLGIFAADVLKRKPGSPIVFEVKCSQGLVEYIKSLGGKPLMWKTGHSLIKAKMKEEHAPLAGEMSGHMFFADGYFGYDDAVFASLRLLQTMAQSGAKLSALAARIPSYVSTPEIRVPCPDELKFEVVAKLAAAFKQDHEVIDIDGARVLFPDGWGLVRASNTQPILVLRFEARTAEHLAGIRDLFYQRLRAFPQVDLKGE
jgi:phosphomannomutase/phosphoglucomutase